MQMKKTTLIIASLILAVLLILFGVYRVLKDFQTRAMQKSADPFALVPADAFFIFHLRSPVLFLESLTKTGPLAEDLSIVLAGEGSLDEIAKLDSILKGKLPENHILEGTSLLISGHQSILTGSRQYLFNFLFPPGIIQKRWPEIFRTAFPDIKPADQYLYRGQSILSYEFNNRIIFFSVYGNSLLISRNSGIIEMSINSVSDNTGINTKEDIRQLREVTGRFADNLYWNTGSLCRYVELYPGFEWPLLTGCDEIYGWQAWDISYNAGHLLLHGFNNPSPDRSDLATLMKHQQKKEPSIYATIPVQAASVFYLGLSDTDVFKQQMSYLLDVPEKARLVEERERRFKDVTGLSPDSIEDIWKGEMAWVVMEGTSLNENVMILDIGDKNSIISHPDLGIFFREVRSNNPENEQEKQVYQCNLPGFLSTITFGMVTSDQGFFAFNGPYLVAANELNVINRYLDKLRHGRNFNDNPSQKLIQEQLPANPNVNWHISIPVLLEVLVKDAESPEVVREIKNKEKFNNFGHITLQMMPSPGPMVFSNLLIQHDPGYIVGNPMIWQTELRAEIIRGPYKVFNHNDRSPEIIVQDAANQLYLIDITGKILWNIELSGPIISDIYQVDIFKNNRYQYLFNTRNYLHLIDRNGNYVRGYPMRLPAPASAGIAVFDYDRNKNYRIIFPAENRRIYNYNLARRPVSGWEYKLSSSLVEAPVQHIRIDGKDFLFVTDRQGNLEILNRRGISRINPRQQLKVNPATRVYAGTIADDPHFIVAAEKGALNLIRLDGSMIQFAPDTFSINYQFVYSDFLDTKEMEMIYLDRNVLSVYNLSDKLIFSIPIPNSENSKPVVLNIKERGKFIGIVDQENHLVFIVDNKGRVAYPFPVQGNKDFYFEHDRENNLLFVTGIGNRIICYRTEI
jgi:hypothetical protein